MRRFLTIIRAPEKVRASRAAPRAGGGAQAGSSGFTQACCAALQRAGFMVDLGRQYFADAGVEVDVIATNRHGISFYITCRGAEQGIDTGATRAAATWAYKQALKRAWALHAQGWGPSLLLTSYAPDTEKARALLAGVNPEVLFDVVNPLTGGRRLRWLAGADERQLTADLARRRKPAGRTIASATQMAQV